MNSIVTKVFAVSICQVPSIRTSREYLVSTFFKGEYALCLIYKEM